MSAISNRPPNARLLETFGMESGDAGAEFDEIVALAVEMCDGSIGIATLLDDDTQVHVSRIGTDIRSVPIEQSFCRYTIEQGGSMVVEDATLDDRFVDNPLVTGEPRIRFYAGIALEADGEQVGALCVLDTEPKQRSEKQLEVLAVLGRQLSAQFSLRRRNLQLAAEARELSISQENLKGFFDALPTEAYLKDEKGQVVFYNAQVAKRARVGAGDWVGRTVFDTLPEETARQIHLEEQHIFRTREPYESYFKANDPDGETVYFKTHKVPFERHDGSLMLACLAVDVTAELKREDTLKKMYDAMEDSMTKLRALSLTDDLTSLPNRRAFGERLSTDIATAARYGTVVSVALMDIDNFKNINDTFGHGYGDEVLQLTANLLAVCLRGGDVAARYGGEEFAILMPNTSEADALKACHRIEQAMHNLSWKNGPVTGSIGIAASRKGDGAESLIERADRALYAAKRAGKARSMVFHDAL